MSQDDNNVKSANKATKQALASKVFGHTIYRYPEYTNRAKIKRKLGLIVFRFHAQLSIA